MKKRVITVSREFGSGGRTIAKKIAEDLGIAYYDKELITKIARESGLDESFIRESGEYASTKSSLLFNLAMYTGPIGSNVSISDQLYIFQHNIITELAEKEDCVIVGRCSDYILREREDCLHTFFHANPAFRADRVVRLYGEREDSPGKRLREMDEKRRIHYRHYTGREWGQAANYHVALDSGFIGVDRCAEIVVQLVREPD